MAMRDGWRKIATELYAMQVGSAGVIINGPNNDSFVPGGVLEEHDGKWAVEVDTNIEAEICALSARMEKLCDLVKEVTEAIASLERTVDRVTTPIR